MINNCLECGQVLRRIEEDLMCASCTAKLENDLRILEDDDLIIEDVFQII